MAAFTGKVVYSFFLLLFVNMNLNAQETGSFDVRIDFESGQRTISFFVPDDYDASKSYPLIVAMHPGGGTTGIYMRDALLTVAEEKQAILACPDDPQYDGRIIPATIEYVKNTYNIDNDAVVITGYSAGGNHTFRYGFANYKAIRGIIGIAPAINEYSSLDYSISNKLPVGLIVGDEDNFKALTDLIVQSIESNNGLVKYIVEPGVGHFGYFTTAFYADWIECYDFIFSQSIPLSAVELIIPEDKAVVEPTNVTFRWQSVKTANRYTFIILDENQYVIRMSDLPETSGGIIERTVEQFSAGKKYYWEVRAENDSATGPTSERWEFTTAKPSGVGDEAANIIHSYASPNPSPGMVEISYEIRNPAYVNISIYNQLGQLVEVLADEFVNSQINSIQWNTRNIENGIYYYRINYNRINYNRIKTQSHIFTGNIIISK